MSVSRDKAKEDLRLKLQEARARRQTVENKVRSLGIKGNKPAIESSTSKKRTEVKIQKVKQPSTKSLALATKQLSSMVKTGLPIVEALKLVAETSDDKNIRISFMDISEGIGKGNSIVSMLERYPQVFDEMYVALADAGEQAGLLAEVLEREAKLLETLARLKAQIQSAMTYPMAIGALVVIVVIVMLLFVIPIFADIYKSSGASLPGLTQFLLDASNWLRSVENLIKLTIGIIVSWNLITWLRKQESVNLFIDKSILKVPVAGELVMKSNLANFSRTLASLNTAGVPLLESLVIAKRTLGNRVYRDIIERMHTSIMKGDQISALISEEKAIPKMFSAMFRIGEETGELSNMVDKLADFYEDEVSTSVKSLTSILEPMMIVVVAGVVAVILIAMYLPMFNMMSTVK